MCGRPSAPNTSKTKNQPHGQPTAPTTRPAKTLRGVIVQIVSDFELRLAFEDLERDAAYVLEALGERLGDVKLRANFQIQVLTSLFFRNKGAYVVGKIINGFNETPFALPIPA